MRPRYVGPHLGEAGAHPHHRGALRLVQQAEDEAGGAGDAAPGGELAGGSRGDDRVLVLAEQLGHPLELLGERLAGAPKTGVSASAA